MQRDWDLMRQILLQLEQKPTTTGVLLPSQVNGWDEDTVSYHMHLLLQAGLIEANCRVHPNAPVSCVARNLTWAGHEFLDHIRADTSWNGIGQVAKEKGIDLSFDAIKQIAGYLLGQVLGVR